MSFHLTTLELREVRIPFRFTFKHSLAQRQEAHSLLLAVHSDTGHIGYGEVLPRPYLTGETLTSAWADIQERWWPAVRGIAFSSAPAPALALREVYLQADGERKLASYGGVDLALHDLWARVHGIPGGRLFGQTPAAQVLTCPLGGGGARSIAWLGRLGRSCRFRDFKLKTGCPDDPQRLRVARRVLGAGRDLRVDANGGWTIDQAMRLSPTLRDCGVSSLEQPIPAGDVDGLARIQRETGIAVMADESLCTRSDGQALLAAGAAKLWNLRLAKVGGFSGFLELAGMARAGGVRIHHGVLVGESAVLAAAARACAGLAEFAHVEYGFPELLLKAQPFRRAPGGWRGVGHPLKAAAGLGVEPNHAVLQAATLRRSVLGAGHA